MSIFDFNRDGEVSSSEQAFGLGAILAALSETEAEVKITIKASTGGDEDYELSLIHISEPTRPY